MGPCLATSGGPFRSISLEGPHLQMPRFEASLRAGVPIAAQNQTVSGIIVLGRVAAGERIFNAEMQAREEREGRRFELEERLRELELASGTPCDFRRRPLRVVVHENPYARERIPPELFRGPWDERYGARDGRIQKLFQGDEIVKLPPQN
jgi:hypothetical protein